MSSKFSPTNEQRAAVDAFRTGANFVLEAGAGTGKTSTLVLLAEAAKKPRGLYLAFNRAVATEAIRKFPANITVKTTHALAMAGTKNRFQHRLQSPKVPLQLAAERLELKLPLIVPHRNPIWPPAQAGLAVQTVRNFCRSADIEIGPHHVPTVPGLSDDARNHISASIIGAACKIWEDVSNPRGHRFKFEHDHYLKAWALRRPDWNYDFVLFDEAQDANPVIADMVASELKKGTQIVAVGDSAQSIYGWRGARDALATINVKHRLQLTQSFRFGEAIASEANKWLAILGFDMRLRGRPGHESIVDNVQAPDAILCRTNATVIAELFAAHRVGRSVGIVGGGDELLDLAIAVDKLKAGKATDHPEYSLFRNWRDLVEYAESGADTNLRVLLKIIDDHGTGAVRRAVRELTPESSARLILSTAHKAKGREWSHVRIAEDFASPESDGSGNESLPERDELMLSYVAVTRAKDALDRGSLDWIDEHAAVIRHRDRRKSTSVRSGTPIRPSRSDDLLMTAAPNPAVDLEGWTPEVDSSLLAGYVAGAPVAALAAIFGRSTDAVVKRISVLQRRGEVVAPPSDAIPQSTGHDSVPSDELEALWAAILADPPPEEAQELEDEIDWRCDQLVNEMAPSASNEGVRRQQAFEIAPQFVGDEVEFTSASGQEPVFGKRPQVDLPPAHDPDHREWRVRTRRVGSTKWIVDERWLASTTEESSVDPFDGLRQSILGEFEITATSPFGTEYQTTMFIAEGLIVEPAHEFRVPTSTGMSHTSIKVTANRRMTVSPSTITLTSLQKQAAFCITHEKTSASLTVKPPAIEFRFAPLWEWGSTTRVLDLAEARQLDRVFIRLLGATRVALAVHCNSRLIRHVVESRIVV